MRCICKLQLCHIVDHLRSVAALVLAVPEPARVFPGSLHRPRHRPRPAPVHRQRVRLRERRPHVPQAKIHHRQPLVLPKRTPHDVADVIQDVNRRI